MPNAHVLNMDVISLIGKMKKKEELMKKIQDLSYMPKMRRNTFKKGAVEFDDSDEEVEESGVQISEVTDMRRNDEFLCTLVDDDNDIETHQWLQAREIENFEPVFEFVRKKYAGIPSKGDIQVVVGGPPCQAFSSANRYKNTANPMKEERNNLVLRFIDIVEFLQPWYVLIENVPNMLNSNGVLDVIRENLTRIGYKSEVSVLAAYHFGLPQTRARSFIWASRGKYPLPHYPSPTHACRSVGTIIHNDIRHLLGSYPKLHDSGPLPQVTVRDFITDLPKFSNSGKQEAQLYAIQPRTVYQERMRSPSGTVTDHESFLPGPGTLSRLRMNSVPLIPGANYQDMPVEVLEGFSKSSINYRKKRCYARATWFGMFVTVTTTINMASEPILHPRQRRVFSVRELARAQGFPDWFEFCGTMLARYRQIGNAVPVVLSQRLGEKLMSAHLHYLLERGTKDYAPKPQILSDLIKTLLSGCSLRVSDEREPAQDMFETLIEELPEELRDPLDHEIAERYKNWHEKEKYIGLRAPEQDKRGKKKKRKFSDMDESDLEFLQDSEDAEIITVTEDEEEFDIKFESEENPPDDSDSDEAMQELKQEMRYHDSDESSGDEVEIVIYLSCSDSD
jgi:DNA-cytosine methyltransferase